MSPSLRWLDQQIATKRFRWQMTILPGACLAPLDEYESVKAETLLRLLRHARSDMGAAAQRNGSVVGR